MDLLFWGALFAFVTGMVAFLANLTQCIDWLVRRLRPNRISDAATMGPTVNVFKEGVRMNLAVAALAGATGGAVAAELLQDAGLTDAAAAVLPDISTDIPDLGSVADLAMIDPGALGGLPEFDIGL